MMKTLSDRTEVTSRMYYYLLDFNEMTDREFIRNSFQKNALNELTITEFLQLFEHATAADVEYFQQFKTITVVNMHSEEFEEIERLLGLYVKSRLDGQETTGILKLIDDRLKELNISGVNE